MQLALLFVAFITVFFAACAGGDPSPATADAGQSTEPTDPPPAPTSTTPPVVDPDSALVPAVESIEPNRATVGSVGPSIIVSGNNFVPRSIVQLDGAPLATTFTSGTELRATIPTGKLTAVGTMRISVGTSPPGGGASREVTFTVENPVPQLTALQPLSVVAGSVATKLTLEGSNFVNGSKVRWQSVELATTYLSATSLEATIPAANLDTSGSFNVEVVNPTPGGGPSTTIAFTVSNPAATVTSINPAIAFVNSAEFEMTVNGTGFVPANQGVGNTVVLFNGTELKPTSVTATQMKAKVPSSLLGAAGDFPVAAKTPPPGGGVSTPVVFRVQYPTPQVTSLAPSTVPAGAGPTEVTVTGVGFFITSQITFDNAPAATTFVDATHVKATLTAAQLATAGSISVRVVNPAPGGGTSSALALTVANAVPTIGSLSPSSVTAGSPDREITIFGSGFVPTSSVRSNGVMVTSAYVSGTQITATIPANQLLFAGSVSLTVTNPAPGGGTSAPRPLTVGCDTSGVDIALGAIGNLTTLPTNFGQAAPMSKWTEAGSCTTVTLTTNVLQPGRYWIVQNTAGVPVTLSAWADCTASGKPDDAYLTFYRRPTLPASDIERLGCATVVSEGLNGPGGYASPELGVSGWCPGLTKANGGGLTLGVCEKAVVHIQPYSFGSQTLPAPPTVKLKPE